MAEDQFASLVSLFLMLFIFLIAIGAFAGHAIGAGRSKGGESGNSFGKYLGIGFLVLVAITWLAMPGTGDGIVKILQGFYVETMKPVGWAVTKLIEWGIVAVIGYVLYLVVRHILARRK